MNPLVQTWFPVLQFSISMGAIALAAYVHFVVQSRVSKAEAAIYDRINAHDHRLTKLETSLDGFPQRSDFHELAKHFSDLRGDLKALTAQTHAMGDTMRATQASVQRVNDYLLNEKKTR